MVNRSLQALRSHRMLLALLLLPGLLIRAAVPAGFMPAVGQGAALTMAMCSGQATQSVVVHPGNDPIPAHPDRRSPPHHEAPRVGGRGRASPGGRSREGGRWADRSKGGGPGAARPGGHERNTVAHRSAPARGSERLLSESNPNVSIGPEAGCRPDVAFHEACSVRSAMEERA